MRMVDRQGAVWEIPENEVSQATAKGLKPEKTRSKLRPVDYLPNVTLPTPAGPVSPPMNTETMAQGAPSMLGGLGSLFPGVQGRGFSALGGLAGEGIREAALGEPLSPHQMLLEAAKQAAFTRLGQGIGGAVQGLGLKTLRGSLNPSPTIQQKAIQVAERKAGQRVSPEAAGIWRQQAQERIGSGPGGLAKAQALIDEQVGQVNRLLRSPQTKGTSFTVDDIRRPLQALRGRLSRSFDSEPKLKAFDAMLDRFRKQLSNPDGTLRKLTPRQLQVLKRSWQDAADRVYAAEAKGVPDELQAIEGKASEAAARGARMALERTPGVGGGIASANQRASELIPLRDALLQAQMANTSASLPFIPPVIAQMVFPQVLRSRAIAGGIGLGLTDPYLLAALGQIPRAAGYALAPPDNTAAP